MRRGDVVENKNYIADGVNDYVKAEIVLGKMEYVDAQEDKQREHRVEIAQLKYPRDDVVQPLEHRLQYRIYAAE